jgi:hypothetical protein
MAVDFAIIGSLVRSGCASLILRHHQAGWRTSTSKLSIMLGNTEKAPPERGPEGAAPAWRNGCGEYGLPLIVTIHRNDLVDLSLSPFGRLAHWR